ncbi:MAG: response regulator [Holophaga sp.]|nr:response regulator [Holophaga sp.]
MKKRILFVDDEPNVLSGLQRMLRSMRDDWEMIFVDSGPKALQEMAQRSFDVVISDMRMPGMNGAELLREAMRLYPATVRIVLSGHAEHDLVNQCVGVAHQYISKPCDPDQLKSMIQNATIISGKLVDEGVKRIVGSIESLPSAPRLYTALEAALKDENSSMQALAEIIQQDIGMTAKILKLVNSSFFGLRRTIENAQEAVNYLGIDTIKGLVLVNGVFENAHPLSFSALTLDDLWAHTLSVANGAKILAKVENLDRHLQEETYIGGVLHDIGVLVLATQFPKQYERVTELVRTEHISIPIAEQWEFGVTHADIGAYLLGLWGIPASILKIVSLHHRPRFTQDKIFSPLLAVHLADVFCGSHSGNTLFEASSLDTTMLEAQGFSPHLERWRTCIDEHSIN